jgi:tetratricopeptide (TPR) repeat protein
VATAALVAAGFAAQSDEPEHDIATSTYCAAFDARLHELWNDDVERRVGERVRALGPAFAVEAWDRAREAIDARTEELAAAQARDCARKGDAEPAAEAVSLCLHRRYESLRAFLGALEQPNATMIAGLDDTVAGLGTAQECEAMHAGNMVTDVALPHLLELEMQLSDARILRSVGKSHAAITAASAPLRLAESLDARYYVAEAEFLVAESQWDLDDREAIASYHRAFAAALASEHDALMARSALALAGVLAEIGRTDEARRWADHAAAAQERTGDTRTLTLIEITRGEIDYYDGDFADARARLERALSDFDEAAGPSVRMKAEQLHAVTVQSMGDPSAAAAELARSAAEGETSLGKHHPGLIGILISQAAALHEVGNLHEAATAAQRAVEISEAAYGREHYGTLCARMEWMAILDASGDTQRAVAIAQDVLETTQRTMEEGDARYPGVLDAVGRVYFTAGRQVDAAALLRDAVRLQEAAQGENHPATLILLGNLAATELGTQQFEAAEVTSRAALDRFRTVFGPDHPRLIGARLRLAAAVQGQGRPAEAIPQLEAALGLAERHDVRGQTRGAIEFYLAMALDESGRDGDRAVELARTALRTYAEAQREGWDLVAEIDEVRAFLNERESGRGRRR